MRMSNLTKLDLLSDGELEKERQGLVKRPRDPIPDTKAFRQLQERFAEAAMARNGKDFIGWFDKLPRNPGPEVNLLDQPMTEAELFDPPANTEQRIYEKLGNLGTRYAASPYFWASYHLEMIKRGLILPSYFAMEKTSETGRARLESSLSTKQQKPLDDAVRNILRRWSGLPHVRGNASIFLDCRTARAWWRGHIARESERAVRVDRERVWGVLHSTEIWTHLMMYSVKSLTVVGDSQLRPAIVARLADEDPVPTDRVRIQKFLQAVGVRTAQQLLGSRSARDNLTMLREMEV